jgi:hypothetical protein
VSLLETRAIPEYQAILQKKKFISGENGSLQRLLQTLETIVIPGKKVSSLDFSNL